MKDLWEKIKENRTISIGIAVLVVLLILTVAFSNSSFNIFNGIVGADDQSANITDSETVSNLLNSLEEEAKNDETSVVVNPFVTEIDGLYYYNRVRIPLLASPELFDYDGIKTVGCGDEIVWVTVDIDTTRAPLTAAINQLMTYDDVGFEPGNFLASQDDLSFDQVVIENGVAKISLEGEFTVDTECDAPRRFIQLEEVAMQFDTVNAVQIFLNGELLR